ETPGTFALHLRQPAWVREGAMQVTVNGETQSAEVGANGYVRLERAWQPGDAVAATLPMHTRPEQTPDGSDYYAVLHGPIVLAAKTRPFENEQLAFLADDSRMGHVAQGPLCPPTAAPVYVGEPEAFVADLEPVSGQPLTFRAPNGLRGTDADLV